MKPYCNRLFWWRNWSQQVSYYFCFAKQPYIKYDTAFTQRRTPARRFASGKKALAAAPKTGSWWWSDPRHLEDNKLEATRALKSPTKMLLPPGEHTKKSPFAPYLQTVKNPGWSRIHKESGSPPESNSIFLRWCPTPRKFPPKSVRNFFVVLHTKVQTPKT